MVSVSVETENVVSAVASVTTVTGKGGFGRSLTQVLIGLVHGMLMSPFVRPTLCTDGTIELLCRKANVDDVIMHQQLKLL